MAYPSTINEEEVKRVTGVSSFRQTSTGGARIDYNNKRYSLKGPTEGGNPVTNSASSTTPSNPSSPPASNNPAVPPVDTRTAEQIEKDRRNEEIGFVENQMKEQNKTALQFGLLKGPETIQGVVDEFKDKQLKQKTATEQELERQKVLDEASAARFNEQAQGSIGSFEATYAQNREGAMSGSTPALVNEFTSEINKQISENKVRLQSAQAQRDQLTLELNEAQKSGNQELADSISRQLASARQSIDQIKANYLNSLTAANQEARMNQEANRQNLTTFTGMVDTGATMTTEGISSMAKTLNIPFDVANSYYAAAANIREDKKLSLNEKRTKLDDLNFNFNEKVAGIRGEQAQAVADFAKLAKSGLYTPEQLKTFATAMNIPNEQNPVYQTKLRLEAANANFQELQNKIEQYKVDHLGQMPPEGTIEFLEYKKAELELQIAEGENADYTGVAPDSALKDVFYQAGKGDYGNGEGKRQCGEAYNDITDGAKVGDSYASKMATVVKRSNPQVGNGLTIPYGDKEIGHQETVISTNPIAGTFRTVSWNRDGKGTQTFQSYSVADLNKKYGSNWGFSNSKLKSKYSNALSKVNSFNSSGKSGIYTDFLNQAKEAGMSSKEAKEWATKKTEESLDAENNNSEGDPVDSLADDAAKGLISFSQLIQGAGKESAKYKAAFTAKLNDLASQEKDPLIKKMILSRAKGDPNSTEEQAWTKASQGFNQVLELKQTLDDLTAKGKTGVINGQINKLDPNDPDVALLKAQLAGVIPTVARGTFGEVGVLTDADIANYQKVVGDMTQTPEQIEKATTNLVRTIYRNYTSSISASSKNTSNRIDQYNEIKTKLPENLKKEFKVVGSESNGAVAQGFQKLANFLTGGQDDDVALYTGSGGGFSQEDMDWYNNN